MKFLKPSLPLCIILDLVGMASFSLPFVGEFTDVIWAPLSALIMLNLFGGKTGKAGAVLSFIEEAFPFIDFIPSFTIMYFVKKYFGAEIVEEGKVTVIK